MTPERWRQIEELYHAAPEERPRLLAEASPEVRHEVEQLLAQRSGDALLDRRAADLLDESTATQLAPGAQIGPYKIESALGVGGMGEVFKARDTRLGRAVAIKITRRQFSARFEREARAISALNHPNICTLHDVGPNYLVMELVEGETLAARLRKGALPMKLVLEYGAQIAAALAAAHERGIVHRDLKPGNIMLAKNGVKVLDFGLARSSEDETLTESRVVMGTPAYMAPEQREGKTCDARTDIYALGLVLYEMATGKRAAQGEVALAEGMPAGLKRLIETCLARDPEDRWQSARDSKRVLEWLAEPEEAVAVRAAAGRFKRYAAGGLALATCIALAVVAKVSLRETSVASPLVRLAIPLPEEGVTANPPGVFGPPAISPGGKTVAVALGTGANRYLWLRQLDTAGFQRVAGTQGANFPFWSPDDRQIGFFAGGKLKKMPAAGGDPQTLCALPAGTERGAAWNSSGTILYGVNYAGLFQVSERGGDPQQVAGLDLALGENSLRNPVFLPDGSHFLYFSRTKNEEDRGIYLDSLPGARRTARKKLLVGDQQLGLASGPTGGQAYLIFARSGKLWAQLLNLHREELEGDPVAIDDDVGLFTVSGTGTLVFRRTDVEQGQFTWFDRAGRELGAVGAPVDSWDVSLSPDDRYVAYNNHRSLDGHFSIWLIDVARNIAAPFSVQTERSFNPVWSRDSTRVYFSSVRGEGNTTFVKAVDDAGTEQVLASSGDFLLRDLASDGKHFLGVNFGVEKRPLVYSSFGSKDWHPLVGWGGARRHGQFSPDGRWVAYDSIESETSEVYVTDFPEGRRKQRISVAGGMEPRWRRDGKEIVFYAPEGALMAVSIANQADSIAGQPTRLFRIRFSTETDGFHYALSSDGQRILLLKETGRERSRDLNVIINWPLLLHPGQQL